MIVYLRLSLFAGLLAFLAPAVYACECVPKRSPSEELKASKGVFIRTVGEGEGSAGDGSSRFRVERSWKGVGGEFINVSGARGTCSRFFRVGETYLVYAFAVAGRAELVSDVCTRTALSKDAAKDLKALGKGKRIRKVSAGQHRPTTACTRRLSTSAIARGGG